MTIYSIIEYLIIIRIEDYVPDDEEEESGMTIMKYRKLKFLYGKKFMNILNELRFHAQRLFLRLIFVIYIFFK